MDFVSWLEEELKQRGWSQSKLAKRGNIRANTVSRVLSHERNPGPDFCRAVARALGYPQEYVFRKAGLIDDPPPSPLSAAYTRRIAETTGEYRPIDTTTDQILQILVKLTPEERSEILALLRVHLAHRQKGE